MPRPAGDMPDELLTRLQDLPGFDNEELIAAMSSATEARFALWRRPPLQGQAS